MVRPPYQGLGQTRLLEIAGAVIPLNRGAEAGDGSGDGRAAGGRQRGVRRDADAGGAERPGRRFRRRRGVATRGGGNGIGGRSELVSRAGSRRSSPAQRGEGDQRSWWRGRDWTRCSWPPPSVASRHLPPLPQGRTRLRVHRGSVVCPIRLWSIALAHWRPSRMATPRATGPRRMSPAGEHLLLAGLVLEGVGEDVAALVELDAEVLDHCRPAPGRESHGSSTRSALSSNSVPGMAWNFSSARAQTSF